MLPLSPPELILSSDSQERLDAFFARFCRGENGRLYKLGHIVYACHAAFPLVISPGLANLTWLNFNTYNLNGAVQKIDPVVVSDFLFSDLVRPVGYRQFEVIPDIRNYFLYLLKDQDWFGYLGAGEFGAQRLSQLAHFLLQYLGDKIFSNEKNVGNASQLNEWAAMAYLSPGLLTSRLAATLKSTFSRADADEIAQLRLNGIIERFGTQYTAGLYEEGAGGVSSFSSLRLYSSGNRARLFEEPTDIISDYFYSIDDSFIVPEQAEDRIGLPVLNEVGRRILRKKEKQQRVLPLLVDSSDEKKGHDIAGLKVFLEKLSGNFGLEITPAKVCEGEAATWFNVREQLATIINSANSEDILLFYFRNNQWKNSDTLYFTPTGSASGWQPIGQKVFTDFLTEIRREKAVQIVFVIDQTLSPGSIFVNGHDIQLSWSFNQKADQSQLFYKVLYNFFVNMTVPVSYSDLVEILRTLVEDGGSVGSPEIRIALHCKPDVGDYIFLTRRPKTQQANRHLIVYNRARGNWQVAPHDFITISKNKTTTVFQYNSPKIVKMAVGEVSDKSGKLLFAGRMDRLNKKAVYEIQPELPPFKIYAEKFETAFSNIVNHIQPDIYSNFSGFKTYLPIASKERDSIQGLHLSNLFQEPASIGVLFNLKERDSGSINKLKFDRIPATHLPVFLKIATRFEYVYNLRYPNPGSGEIDVDTTFSWIGDKSERQFEPSGQLALGKEAFTIRDGRITICQIGARAKSFEDTPVYLDIYILTGSLQIKRLTNQFTTVGPIQTRELFFDEQELVSDMLSNDQFAVIKILLSYFPILIDFTQDGYRPELI